MMYIEFVELFRMSVQAYCSCSNTFVLKVHILTVPWCSCSRATVIICNIKTRLEICSSRVMATSSSVFVVYLFSSLR